MTEKFADSPVKALVLRGLARNRAWLAGGICSTGVAAILEGGTFAVILLALKVIDSGPKAIAQYAGAWTASPPVALFLSLRPSEAFASLILLAVLFQACRSALNCVGIEASVRVGTHIQADVEKAVFQKIMRLPFADASQYRSGELADVVTAPATAVFDVTVLAAELLVGAITIVCYGVLLVRISPVLTIIAIVFFLVAAIAQRGLVRRIRERSVQMSTASGAVMHKLVETFSGLRTIHSFQQQDESISALSGTVDEVVGLTRQIHNSIAILRPLSETLSVFAVGVLLVVGMLVLPRTTGPAIAELLVFTALLNRMAGRTTQMTANVADIAKRTGPMRRADIILGTATLESADVARLTPFSGFQEELRFVSVSLKYVGTSHPAVQDVSFRLQRGTTTALVGASGSGKSSIADLLLRLYEPTCGQITSDGRDICEFDLKSWRESIGVVSQDAFLFSTTILENIRFGKSYATEAEVIAAARVANAHDFIEALPSGYATVVGERGYGLSGGQRQRIALARAVLRQPSILILDEATSALDSISERLIQDALDRFSENRTVLVIAHRLSTITKADQILLIENGRVEEAGNHRELLGLGGSYARYWELQAGAESR